MFNKSLFKNDIEENDNNKENKDFTEEDYDQINKEISKALFEMKKEKEEEGSSEENNNEQEKEQEKDLDNFDYDFFSENSNSISNDNISDISDNSFKSAKVEMNTNNSLKIKMMKNNFKINNNSNNNNINNNNFSGATKDVSSSSNEGINESLNQKKSSFNSIQNERNNILNNNNLNLENAVNNNKSFNSSPFLVNLGNTKDFQTNYLNEPDIPKIPSINNLNNLNMNNNNNVNKNINNINNMQLNIPNLINNINNNQNINLNIQQPMINNNLNNQQSMINNNINNQNPMINNNLNFLNINNNYFANNNPINNINLINYNNNINNNNFLMNNNANNSNNFIQMPTISDRGVPGLYNLDSPKNIMNLDNILKSRDKRTTLIIRNIPNKYTISLLLDELNQNFENKFDIVYLPQDYINNSNLGFGFINFVNHMHLILFYDEFVGKKWNCFNSKKRCQLAYSKYQGKNELMKYIHTKLGISNLDNNNENIKKSFFINNNKNIRAPIEIPIKYYANFISFYPFSLCHNKDDKVFIIDKYYNI